jgi:phosphorylcholine metabolism protein LicD
MYIDKWHRVNKNINLSVPMIERENVNSEISNVIEFLNDIKSCNYFFSCGTALGIVREGKLLDWDTDVDIDVINPTEFIIEDIINQMEKLDYSFQRVLKRKGKYSQIVFIKEPYHSIDFCFWYYEKDYLLNDVPELTFLKRIHKTQLYNEFKFIEWNGLDIRIPAKHDEYFKCLYGEDWKKPKKYSLWISNANDIKIDFSIFRIILKILWKINMIRKGVIRKFYSI